MTHKMSQKERPCDSCGSHLSIESVGQLIESVGQLSDRVFRVWELLQKVISAAMFIAFVAVGWAHGGSEKRVLFIRNGLPCKVREQAGTLPVAGAYNILHLLAMGDITAEDGLLCSAIREQFPQDHRLAEIKMVNFIIGQSMKVGEGISMQQVIDSGGVFGDIVLPIVTAFPRERCKVQRFYYLIYILSCHA